MQTTEAIRERHTLKMLAETPWPTQTPSSLATARLLPELCALAGWAPFHQPCHSSHRKAGLDALAPWRFYLLDADGCRRLADFLARSGRDAGKLLPMLWAADALVQATWLPNPPEPGTTGLFEADMANMEHLAAASAAVQNMLLAATDAGLNNYWSSGGLLREAWALEHLGIPTGELLLASVFLFPNEAQGPCLRMPGKLREKRGQWDQWARWARWASPNEQAAESGSRQG